MTFSDRRMPDMPASRPDHIVFFGTPDVAVASLRGLCEAGLPVELVVTGVDKRRSRGTATSPSPVKVAAGEIGIPVVHDLAEMLSVVASLEGTVLGVVVAYGRLLPANVLDALPLVNLHFSLLPRWRGAAPVERAILAGDSETGACLMRVRPELDSGEVFAKQSVPIGGTDTLEDLRGALNHAGVALLVAACRDGFGIGTPQVGEATYAHKITTDDLRLTWESVDGVVRRVRVGGAFGVVAGQRVKVHECRIPPADTVLPDVGNGSVWSRQGAVGVRCGDGGVELITVQPEGRARMAATAWWNGLHASTSVQFDA